MRSVVAILLLLCTPAQAQSPLRVVAAETVYGDVAGQLAGPRAVVASILSDAAQDPHLFEASPSVARQIADAAIVVLNGANYDPWMRRLLTSAPKSGRQVVDAGQLSKHAPGSNPHLWFDPAVMPLVARALTASLAQADAANRAEYESRLDAFLASLKPIDARVLALRTRFVGVPVTATEPVFGLMASALGLTMRNERFQLAVMNDAEPRLSDVAAFEADLRLHRVRALFYNSQASGAAARRMVALARANSVPVVGVAETKPAELTYQAWMLAQLDALERALAAP
jgi:zinc/manganese transport system substrate-binding protein